MIDLEEEELRLLGKAKSLRQMLSSREREYMNAKFDDGLADGIMGVRTPHRDLIQSLIRAQAYVYGAKSYGLRRKQMKVLRKAVEEAEAFM